MSYIDIRGAIGHPTLAAELESLQMQVVQVDR